MKHRLLINSADESDQWFGVAHEALLTTWEPPYDAIGERAATLREVRSRRRRLAEHAQAAGDISPRGSCYSTRPTRATDTRRRTRANNRLKRYRAIATRYAKRAVLRNMLAIAAILIRLR